jgi:hypothetical protein
MARRSESALQGCDCLLAGQCDRVSKHTPKSSSISNLYRLRIDYGQEVTDFSFEPEPIGSFTESLRYTNPPSTALIDLMIVCPVASALTSNRLFWSKIIISAIKLLVTAAVPNVFTAMHISLLALGNCGSIAAHTPLIG